MCYNAPHSDQWASDTLDNAFQKLVKFPLFMPLPLAYAKIGNDRSWQ
jgi:hypothetical protein